MLSVFSRHCEPKVIFFVRKISALWRLWGPRGRPRRRHLRTVFRCLRRGPPFGPVLEPYGPFGHHFWLAGAPCAIFWLSFVAPLITLWRLWGPRGRPRQSPRVPESPRESPKVPENPRKSPRVPESPRKSPKVPESPRFSAKKASKNQIMRMYYKIGV